MAFSYSLESHRYRDDTSGRYLSVAQVREVRGEFVAAQKEAARGLGGLLSRGEVTRDQWESGMRGLVKETHIAQAILGKGGRDQMTPADWGRVGAELRGQYGFLGQFAGETAALSEAQIAARAEMYVSASNAAYERARAADQGANDLPAYPGDGSSECLSGCTCSWDFDEDGATWTLGDSKESCETCLGRASDWVGLPVSGGVEAVAA
jgi:hypothetical protein